jgi:hypothetical protein
MPELDPASEWKTMNARIKIISGGQSGVDRAALEAARERGLVYGGWCPAGGWAEDLPAPPGVRALYPLLAATPSADPAQRTEWNVRDSDAVLILVDIDGLVVSRGTRLAHELAAKYARPLFVVDLSEPDALARAAAWLRAQLARAGPELRLAVGGPRESEAPGIQARAQAAIDALLERV